MADTMEDEWLWGWDPTPGIVSVWAEPDGRAFLWRRIPGTGELVREDVRFRPWLLLSSLEDLAHLGARLRPESEGPAPQRVTYQELEGPGALRYVVRADDGRALAAAVLRGATQRLGRSFANLRELGAGTVLALPPEEQYLVMSGRTYFRELGFDELRRMQFDLETTGLDPDRDRIFLVAVRAPDGRAETLEAHGYDKAAEADLLRRFVACVRVLDPDIIENHNLHGFDLPFLARRAQLLGVPLALGRAGAPGLRQRPAARGAALGRDATGRAPELMRRSRYTMPGRELIDTLDAVRRHDFSARDLPGHGLKAVARHLGLSGPDRELIPGARVYEVFGSDPERVRRYARDDVTEAAGVARMLGGAAFALARMAPRRYERLADAGPATGVLDPLLVRAYLRAGAALPAHEGGDGTPHSGAALHLFATGVARRIVKADVASLYPSLMREYRIGPKRDRLNVLLALVDRLVDQRLAAKARARAAAPGSPERYTNEALSAAMKIVVNSAYGYLGAVGLTRFSDVHAANEVTRRGREVLGLLCRELARRGVTLLEADTDGVYFSVPDGWREADERRVVSEVAALLPPRVQLEFDGRYAAMLSHEPKNYALQPYEGPLLLRGVAFRSSRAEPFGEDFLRRALHCLLAGDIPGVRDAYVSTVLALRRREVPTLDVAARVRLTKAPQQYLATRASRRELSYEAVLASGRTHWAPGEHVRVYRAVRGRAGLLPDPDAEDTGSARSHDDHKGGAENDPRDYDAEFYVRLLRETFAARLVRALTPEDFAAVFADPEQPSLFAPSLAQARPILTVLPEPHSELSRDTLE
ncbi:ribonuclease H-like domain-containing protein [Vitiosangium sp. GDMCC 1.1324]|uniref:ribonuclease H-like domain-containing protein n=1 Tax=Vitiosangium sp. (strain GDMCC 1.1324) TaxID=2138576 RepID=UPI000D396CE4|nr:ribonuclease H-like domain-containing protein [Vitiosangium sp. GDMCC 1.1324]PTL85902.1 DNA polymerase II [Vitiosangium sp. GDMCC 1.1324]